MLIGENKKQRVAYLLEHLQSDEAANIILKGHLVIEEGITSAILGILPTPEHIDKARLSFSQKLALWRCLSPLMGNDPMWETLSKLNALRNSLSHSLDGERRSRATDSLISTYVTARGYEFTTEEKENECLLLMAVISGCMAFVDATVDTCGSFQIRIP